METRLSRLVADQMKVAKYRAAVQWIASTAASECKCPRPSLIVRNFSGTLTIELYLQRGIEFIGVELIFCFVLQS